MPNASWLCARVFVFKKANRRLLQTRLHFWGFVLQSLIKSPLILVSVHLYTHTRSGAACKPKGSPSHSPPRNRGYLIQKILCPTKERFQPSSHASGIMMLPEEVVFICPWGAYTFYWRRVWREFLFLKFSKIKLIFKDTHTDQQTQHFRCVGEMMLSFPTNACGVHDKATQQTLAISKTYTRRRKHQFRFHSSWGTHVSF